MMAITLILGALVLPLLVSRTIRRRVNDAFSMVFDVSFCSNKCDVI